MLYIYIKNIKETWGPGRPRLDSSSGPRCTRVCPLPHLGVSEVAKATKSSESYQDHPQDLAQSTLVDSCVDLGSILMTRHFEVPLASSLELFPQSVVFTKSNNSLRKTINPQGEHKSYPRESLSGQSGFTSGPRASLRTSQVRPSVLKHPP